MHLAPGAFQDEAATSALVRRVTERKKAEVWDGFRIFEAAKAGDPICQEELDRLADLLGMGIANICFVINPERIILGGGIMEPVSYTHLSCGAADPPGCLIRGHSQRVLEGEQSGDLRVLREVKGDPVDAFLGDDL